MWTGNTTLQDQITNALTAERERLEQLVEAVTTKEVRKALAQLLVTENTLSDLVAFKQEHAKSFRRSGKFRWPRLSPQNGLDFAVSGLAPPICEMEPFSW